MTQHNTENIKLCYSQLENLKPKKGKCNCSNFKRSIRTIGKSETDFLQRLLSRDSQTTNVQMFIKLL